MATEKSPTKPSTKSVVFADNDPIVLEAITDLLREKGYEVHPARDGLEALLLIRKLRPSIVILDIVMPKIDGSRVCWLIRQDRLLRHTPVIAFSGLSPEQIRRFPELSADAYVAKGPLAVVANNILMAIKHLEEGGGDFAGGIFGYEGFQARNLVSEMQFLKRHWETLVRTLPGGMLEVDADGRILMASAATCELLGKKEFRLIAESLLPLLSPQDRKGVQRILDEFRNTNLREERLADACLGGREVSMRFFAIVEERECLSILVIIEPKP